MSYQQPGYQQSGYPAARRSGGTLVVVGVLLVLIGIVAGGALYVSGKQNYSSKVKNLVTQSGALSGCVTDLSFEQPGTYTLYYVSKGSVRINGANDGCASADVVPVAADPNLPEIALKLTNSDGRTLRLSAPASSTVIRESGVVAEPYRQVNISVIGDYQLEVASPDTGLPFALGVGSAINKTSSLLALVVGLVGVVFGAGAVLLGLAQGTGTGASPGYGAPYQQAPAQAPSTYPPRQAAYPAQPQPQRPAMAPPVQRPAQPGAQRPAQAPSARPQQIPPTVRQPQQGGPAPTVRQPQQPASVPPPVQRDAQQRPQQPGTGLPPIVSSLDESGSISSPPPTQRMPSSGWERQPAPPPTRPLTSQRPVPPPPDPDEDSD